MRIGDEYSFITGRSVMEVQFCHPIGRVVKTRFAAHMQTTISSLDATVFVGMRFINEPLRPRQRSRLSFFT